MVYFKIGNNDYSMYVNELSISNNHNYASQTNAAGNTVVDLINSKRTIQVGIIPVDNAAMLSLQNDIAAFSVSISFLNPATNTLEENVACIIPTNEVSYYTIRSDKTTYNGFNLVFQEL